MSRQLLRICAWCNREIGTDGAAVGEPQMFLSAVILEDRFVVDKFAETAEPLRLRPDITHGMCKSCEQAELRKLLPEKVKIVGD